mmetsp:Transcript_5342/g.24063  ORF Transcript_5342/g.24063 Transcript_5342/m.24063 type:complete len:201 (+) Transcript_5342:699-1301(+)
MRVAPVMMAGAPCVGTSTVCLPRRSPNRSPRLKRRSSSGPPSSSSAGRRQPWYCGGTDARSINAAASTSSLLHVTSSSGFTVFLACAVSANLARSRVGFTGRNTDLAPDCESISASFMRSVIARCHASAESISNRSARSSHRWRTLAPRVSPTSATFLDFFSESASSSGTDTRRFTSDGSAPAISIRLTSAHASSTFWYG